MALVEMTKDLETGHFSIDEQHKELFDRINALHDAVEGEKDVSQIETVFDFLENYVIAHFSMEEKLMIKESYPDYEKHKDKHVYFIKEFMEIRDSFTRNKKDNDYWEDVKLMESLLKDWLLNHIKTVDKELGIFLTGNV